MPLLLLFVDSFRVNNVESAITPKRGIFHGKKAWEKCWNSYDSADQAQELLDKLLARLRDYGRQDYEPTDAKTTRRREIRDKR